MNIVFVLILFTVAAFSSEFYYSLQLGAFSTKKYAYAYVEELKKRDKGLKLFVIYDFGLYKVYVGEFNSYKKAKAKKNLFDKKLNLDTFVKKIVIHKKVKKRSGIQVLAAQKSDTLKIMERLIAIKYRYDILKKDSFYKLVIKCDDKKDCREKLYIIRDQVDKNAFIVSYTDSELFSLNQKEKMDKDIELNSSYDSSRVEISINEKNDQLSYELDEKSSPEIVSSRYFLYENKITNSKFNVNGKKYTKKSSTNSLGLGMDIYDNYFLTGKLGTRTSSKYLVNINGKAMDIKVSYPIVASVNLGYKYYINSYELYELYLYSALGTLIVKKNVEIVDFNNVKNVESSTYFDFSISSGLIVNFYNKLFLKAGAIRDFKNRENSIEFSLNYEFWIRNLRGSLNGGGGRLELQYYILLLFLKVLQSCLK